jgi:hypothetical protein
LGTPHRGSGAAGPATLLGNIFEAVWSPVGFVSPGPRKKLVSDLQRNSKVLFAISDRFLGRANALEIASLYESDQMAPLRNVVSPARPVSIDQRTHAFRWSMRTLQSWACRTRRDGPCSLITAIFVGSTMNSLGIIGLS